MIEEEYVAIEIKLQIDRFLEHIDLLLENHKLKDGF